MHRPLNGAVVQLVRIHACHAWGREFESRPHRSGERKWAIKLSSLLLIFYNAIQIFQELPTIFEVSGKVSVGAYFLHSSFFGAVTFFGSGSKTKSLNFHCPISFKYAKIEAK